GLITSLIFARATVYVDNETPWTVWLVINGKQWRSLQPKQQMKTALTHGTYQLEVYDQSGGTKLDTMQIEVAGHSNYVLNVLCAQVYKKGALIYRIGGDPGPPVQLITDKWFTADVDYLFVPPPKSFMVTYRKDEGLPHHISYTKTFLSRGGPPPLQ